MKLPQVRMLMLACTFFVAAMLGFIYYRLDLEIDRNFTETEKVLQVCKP
jgi:hypothetical protein